MIDYVETKAAMAARGLPVSAGSGWNAVDSESYSRFVPDVAYTEGMPLTEKTEYAAHYGFAYPSLMPAQIVAAVTEGSYSATLAGTPLTGTAPLSVTWTLTEEGGEGTSFLWDLDDGTTQTTSVPTITHSYAAAGSFTASVVPTVNGVTLSAINGAAPAVVSA